MLSIPDMALLGAAALLLFGPEQLPRVARKAGNVMREIQNTSQSFIREMERAADLQDEAEKPYVPPPYDPVPYDAAAYDGASPYDDTAGEHKPYDDAPTVAMPVTVPRAYEPPAPDPEPPPGAAEPSAGVAEKLAEPRPALGFSEAAEPAPQGDHPAHL